MTASLINNQTKIYTMFNRFRNLLSIGIKKDNKASGMQSVKATDIHGAELTQIERYNNLMKKFFVFNLKKVALLRIIESDRHDEGTIKIHIEQFYILAEEIGNDIKKFIRSAEEKENHFS